MIIETEILLGDLQLGHDLRARHRAEQWMKRLTRLEVYRPILHLQQHVCRKLSVECLELVVGRSGAVVTGLHVVDKGTPHHDPMMWRERSREHVRAVSMSAIVRSWTRLSFAVCFDEEATEVWDQLVNLIGLLLPPFDHCRIERIGSRQLTQFNRRGKTWREVDANSVGPKDVGDCSKLVEILCCEELGTGVDIIQY